MTGEGDGSYGNVLLEIELRSEAWILDYGSGTVLGVDGSKGTLTDLHNHPDRLAAVLYLGEGYREIVIVNEKMVARWSAGAAPEVIQALRKDTEFLLATADAIDDDLAKTPGIPSPTAQLLHQTLAFTRKLSSEELRSRAKLLDTYRSIARIAVTKEPKAQFVLGKQRPPLIPICKVIRHDTHFQSQYVGSFASPKKSPIYLPVCGPASPTVVCQGNQGLLPTAAVCTPLPVFGE